MSLIESDLASPISSRGSMDASAPPVRRDAWPSPIFADLSPCDVRDILARAQLTTYARDDVALRAGEAPRAIFFPLSGRFACRRISRDGLLFVLQRVSPGEFFGEAALVCDAPCDIEVVAIERSRAYAFAAQDFWRIMESHPSVSRRMLRALSSRVGQYAERTFELATMNVETRLRRTIGKLAEESDQLRDGGVIRPAPTHAELAHLLGTTREVVSRSLMAMTKQGSIRTGRQEIMIRSVRRLRGETFYG